MDSVHLLIIDHSPEAAEQVNSLLRNSGINIHISFADSAAAAELMIKQQRPFLLIYNATNQNKSLVTDALDLAQKHAIPFAVRFLLSEPATLISALEKHSCLAINAEDNDQLINTVGRILKHEKGLQNSGDIQSSLEELQHRYHLLLESSKDSIAYLHEGLHIYANPAYLDLLRVNKFEDIEAISLLEIVHSQQADLKKLLRAMNNGKFPEESIIVGLSAPSGDEVEVQLEFSPAQYDGENCVQMLVTEKDVHTTLKNEVARLRKTDMLTQLMNRQAFIAELKSYLQTDTNNPQPGSILYLEPDGARDMQDRWGTSVFDRFVEQFAATIRECTTDDNITGRFSDYGFTILVKSDSKKSTDALLNTLLRQTSDQEFEVDGEKLSVTCSIGVATIGLLTKNSEETITQAVFAHHQAAVHADCYKHFVPASMDEGDLGNAEWAERIRYALNTKRLYSVQQSIVNLEGESEGLYENKTFIREENQDLPAEEFMFQAEQNNLGSAIDRFVIPGLLKTIAGTGDRHILNLSSNSVLDFSFPSWFQHQLSELGVEGSQVILQVTASVAASSLKPLVRLVDELKPVGCNFSLSMFDNQDLKGTLLDHLDVAMVKLPPELSHSLTSNSDNQQIVRDVVSAANAIRAGVIADEILDAADLAVLWQCGVKLVAGEFLKETSTYVAG